MRGPRGRPPPSGTPGTFDETRRRRPSVADVERAHTSIRNTHRCGSIRIARVRGVTRMKLHPLSLSTHGPPTPAKAPRDNARDDAVDKYHRDRLAFISAVRAAPQSLEGVGGALLVRLCQDPEPDVALGACRAVNAVLGEHGPQVGVDEWLKEQEAASGGGGGGGLLRGAPADDAAKEKATPVSLDLFQISTRIVLRHPHPAQLRLQHTIDQASRRSCAPPRRMQLLGDLICLDVWYGRSHSNSHSHSHSNSNV